jgi:hypothetical protein
LTQRIAAIVDRSSKNGGQFENRPGSAAGPLFDTIPDPVDADRVWSIEEIVGLLDFAKNTSN